MLTTRALKLLSMAAVGALAASLGGCADDTEVLKKFDGRWYGPMISEKTRNDAQACTDAYVVLEKKQLAVHGLQRRYMKNIAFGFFRTKEQQLHIELYWGPERLKYTLHLEADKEKLWAANIIIEEAQVLRTFDADRKKAGKVSKSEIAQKRSELVQNVARDFELKRCQTPPAA